MPHGGLKSLNTPAEQEAFSKEIVEWMTKTVSNHKRLRGGCILVEAIPKSFVIIDFVGTSYIDIPFLPFSPAGKILRKDLRARANKEVEEEEVRSARQAKL